MRTETTSGRGDEFSRAHWFECEVELGGERLRSGFTLLYNLNADISGTEKGKAPHGLKPDAQSRGHEVLHQSATAPVDKTLAAPDDGVNLTFLNGAADGRSGARGRAGGYPRAAGALVAPCGYTPCDSDAFRHANIPPGGPTILRHSAPTKQRKAVFPNPQQGMPYRLRSGNDDSAC